MASIEVNFKNILIILIDLDTDVGSNKTNTIIR